MAMTVAVTRNSPGRIRGLLASVMCEVAPGVYTSPRMSAGVRDRLWAVLEEWFRPSGDHSILLTWPDSKLPGGQAVRGLGIPKKELADHHGIYLTRRPLSDEEQKRLEVPASQE